MDILRKELNEIYLRQRLTDEQLPHTIIDRVINSAETLAETTRGCTVVTDAASDKCYICARDFGHLIGLTNNRLLYMEMDSADEDEIYSRLHPEDLVEKRMLEYEFFKLTDSAPADEKLNYKATCQIRMKDRTGGYSIVENSTQIIRLSPGGKIWLILCCYTLSSYQRMTDGISPRIVNCHTGEISTLSFKNQRSLFLSAREKQILRLIQQGKASKNIADILSISIHTVNRHRQNIIEKLSVGNSIEAIAAAEAMKLL